MKTIVSPILLLTILCLGCTEYNYESTAIIDWYKVPPDMYGSIETDLKYYAEISGFRIEEMSDTLLKKMNDNRPGLLIKFYNRYDKISFIANSIGKDGSTIRLDFFRSGFSSEENMESSYLYIVNIIQQNQGKKIIIDEIGGEAEN